MSRTRTHIDQAIDRTDPRRAYFPSMRIGVVCNKWPTLTSIGLCIFLLFSETTRVGESMWSMLQETGRQLQTWFNKAKVP